MYDNLKPDLVNDYKAKGANKLFGLLYDQYLGQISTEGFIEEANEIYSYLSEYVRNIYEHIHTEIPVMLYLDILSEDNMEDIGVYDKTKEQALKEIKEAIHNFYAE